MFWRPTIVFMHLRANISDENVRLVSKTDNEQYIEHNGIGENPQKTTGARKLL